MKLGSRCLFVMMLAILATVVGSCGREKSEPRVMPGTPRVVRLRFSNSGRSFLLSVNSPSIEGRQRTAFTNDLSSLRLGLGDVVLFERPPSDSLTDYARTCWVWLEEHCNSNKVALYVFQPRKEDAVTLQLPTYHWLTPYGDPRLSLSVASFYFEGKLLGTGTNGFFAMMADIERSRSPNVFMLSSRFDPNTGFSPSEAPFWEYQSVLEETLSRTRTKEVILTQQP